MKWFKREKEEKREEKREELNLESSEQLLFDMINELGYEKYNTSINDWRDLQLNYRLKLDRKLKQVKDSRVMMALSTLLLSLGNKVE